MNTERKRGGRIPKLNPKSHHVMLRFDDDEWMKFLVMYEQTDVKAKAVFAKARIFGEPFKVLREDKTLVEYYTKLSSFHSQYRMIGNNYNQIGTWGARLRRGYQPGRARSLESNSKGFE